MEVKSKLAGTLQGKELEMVIEKMTEMRNTYQGIFYERLKIAKVPKDLNCHEAIEFLFKDVWVKGAFEYLFADTVGETKNQDFVDTFMVEVLFEDELDLEGMLFEPEYRLSLKRLEMVDTFLNKWLVNGF
jgi:hypothetical protein